MDIVSRKLKPGEERDHKFFKVKKLGLQKQETHKGAAELLGFIKAIGDGMDSHTDESLEQLTNDFLYVFEELAEIDEHELYVIEDATNVIVDVARQDAHKVLDPKALDPKFIKFANMLHEMADVIEDGDTETADYNDVIDAAEDLV